MKFYVAELVSTAIALLCALTNHAHGCFVWRKLMPLDLWASNIMDERGANQLHRFTAPPVPMEPNCNCLGAAAVSWHYCPAHGMVHDA